MSNLDVHFSSKSNEWETPDEIYRPLNAKFMFDMDLAASPENAKHRVFFSQENSALDKNWIDYGKAGWMNPPYGREVGDFMEYSYHQSIAFPELTLVHLVPARTDTKWYQEFCAKGDITYIKGRIKFINREKIQEQEDKGEKIIYLPAPFPSAIVVFRNGLTNPPNTKYLTQQELFYV